MNREEIEKKVIKCVAEQLSLEVENIDPAMDFISGLGFDSLDSVEMTMCIEDEFGISIKDEVAEKLANVNLVVDYLEQNIEEE
jgi:acyl carrier protein